MRKLHLHVAKLLRKERREAAPVRRDIFFAVPPRLENNRPVLRESACATDKEERAMNEVSVWIEHLRHPLVLAGFGLFVFALIIKPLFLSSKQLNGTAVERLLHKAMILLFILAAMAVAGGLALNWKDANAGKEVAQQNSGGKTAAATVEQVTGGDKSPVINSGENARINYGGAASGAKKPAKKADARAQEQQPAPAQVKQETKGEKSPAINSKGNVEINYAD
jgi:hypothetical protein